ncbi:MAG: Asp23/Gls24 family envelope stress response protein [Suipraeoptans sp.]
MEKEVKDTYTVTFGDNISEIKIADEVVESIAGIAAMEVEGVDSTAGKASSEFMGKLGRKSLSKGIKVDIIENDVTVFASINIKYGYNIMDITTKVQDKIKSAIESMTGLTVDDVNVRVAGVSVSEDA